MGRGWRLVEDGGGRARFGDEGHGLLQHDDVVGHRRRGETTTGAEGAGDDRNDRLGVVDALQDGLGDSARLSSPFTFQRWLGAEGVGDKESGQSESFAHLEHALHVVKVFRRRVRRTLHDRVTNALVGGLGAHDDEGLLANLGDGPHDGGVALEIGLGDVVVEGQGVTKGVTSDELQVDAVGVRHQVLVSLDECVSRVLRWRARRRGADQLGPVLDGEARPMDTGGAKVEGTASVGCADVANRGLGLGAQLVLAVRSGRGGEEVAEVAHQLGHIVQDDVNIAVEQVRLGALGASGNAQAFEGLDDVRSSEAVVGAGGRQNEVGVRDGRG